MVAAGKSLETKPIQDKGKEKMESYQSQALEDMCNVIKTLSDKLNKLELENKNFQKQCYALNLQNDTQIQNMRRKDTQNTE